RDWTSDVCSSDLLCHLVQFVIPAIRDVRKQLQQLAKASRGGAHDSASAYTARVAAARSRTACTSSGGASGIASPAKERIQRAKVSWRRTRNVRQFGRPSTGSPSSAPARATPLPPENSTTA